MELYLQLLKTASVKIENYNYCVRWDWVYLGVRDKLDLASDAVELEACKMHSICRGDKMTIRLNVSV